MARSLYLVALVLAAAFCVSCRAAAYPDYTAHEKRNTPGSPPRMPYGTSIWNSSQLPNILGAKADLTNDHQSVETIRNKVALYAFIVDGKQWDTLGNVFASNAVANYSTPLYILSGLDNITATLNQSMQKVSVSQHQIGSQFIEIVDSRNAYSVSYYTSTQFGAGDYANEALYSRGQYQDTWYRANPRTQDWHIIFRNLVYMVGRLHFPNLTP